MQFPFEVEFAQIELDYDSYIDATFSSIQSEFLLMPKGEGFVEYPVFEKGYESLKHATRNFRNIEPDSIINAVYETPISLIVLRSILGFTPPEWAAITTQRIGFDVPQGAVRTIDRKIRMNPLISLPAARDRINDRRLKAMIKTACELLNEGAPTISSTILHRLDKSDTKFGLTSLQSLADLGVPYAMVLYERFLGRPFASHRDSVSELIGDALENAIEEVLSRSGISFRKTKRTERIPGFDQAPDFIIPDEFNPQVVIEAKISEDDGTARDKVTRVQHLGELSMKGRRPGEKPKFEVIACIDGRGFKVRREDMKKLLNSTRGKVFTLKNFNRLIECSRLNEFKTK